MSHPQVSVVVPFYDETAYLRLAVNSVLAQRIDGTEVIVVNDNPGRFDAAAFGRIGLPDGVRVIHQDRNRGLSAARNAGIAASRGDWIGFLDADDYYLHGGLARQLAVARETGAELVHAQCMLRMADGAHPKILPRDVRLFAAGRAGTGLLGIEEAQFITSSWSSLYRRDFIDRAGLTFDEDQVRFEDRLFVLQSVTAARSIAVAGFPARVWRRRAGSISTSKPDMDAHRLQVQLLEKCLAHMRRQVSEGVLPPRFLKREVFNSVSRLVWDMRLVDAIATAPSQELRALGERAAAALGDDRFGHAIFSDPVLRQISRVGMRTRRGFVTRKDFFDLHRRLREGRFDDVHALLSARTPSPAVVRGRRSNRSVPADLVLHLGTHKTGSTFIQHTLRHHAGAMRRAGVLVPETGQADRLGSWQAVRHGGFCGHQGILEAAHAGDGAVRDHLYREVRASGAHTVVLSCENMLMPLAEDRAERISALMAFLDGFRSCRTVAMIRRPDLWLDRYYREIVCNGVAIGPADAAEFVVDHQDAFTDLPALLDPFERATGKPAILGDFDASLRGEGVWRRFLSIAGLDGIAHLPPPEACDAGYPSPPRPAVRMAEMVNRLVEGPELRRAMLAQLFTRHDGAGPGASLLPPDLRLGLIERFNERSRAFAADRGYAPEIDAWRAGLAAERWSPDEPLDAELLRDISEARQIAESVISPRPMPTRRTVSAAVPARGALTLRVRPRPWVLNGLGWMARRLRPGFASRF